jgi:hypothetical protein
MLVLAMNVGGAAWLESCRSALFGVILGAVLVAGCT